MFLKLEEIYQSIKALMIIKFIKRNVYLPMIQSGITNGKGRMMTMHKQC
jgi:hypothetical protein